MQENIEGHHMPGMQDEQHNHKLPGDHRDIWRQLRGREEARGDSAREVRDKSVTLLTFANS